MNKILENLSKKIDEMEAGSKFCDSVFGPVFSGLSGSVQIRIQRRIQILVRFRFQVPVMNRSEEAQKDRNKDDAVIDTEKYDHAEHLKIKVRFSTREAVELRSYG